jgi:hypothetical protein
MSNLRTNLFQGDLYIESSLDPTIYGTGKLNIDGDLTVGGTFSSVGGSTFNTLIINGNTSGTITIRPQAASGTYNFNLPTTSGTSGQVLTSGGGGLTAMTWTTLTTGTVTSVALTVPSFLSISGSPITSSGTLAVTLSGTALPIANGGTGSTTATGSGSVVLQNSPTFISPNIDGATGSSLTVTGNVNSLTKSITGSSSGVITIRGQAVAGTYNFNLPTSSGTSGQVLTSAGGVSSPMTWTTPTSGTVTSVALTVPSFLSISGSPITSSGTFAVTLSGTALPILNGGTGSTTATGTGSVVLQTSPTLTTPVLGVATGTSLSVTGNVNSLTHTITGSTSGVITIQGQASAGTYNFNLPITSGTSGQVLTSAGGGTSAMTWTSVGGGTVTSVALSVPSFLSVTGSPITSSGTLAVTLSGTALPILNGGTGSTTSTGSGSVVLQNTPTLTTPNIGVATGASLSVTGQLISTLENGTAPLVVTSTTLVTNLNANYLGNATFASPAIIGSGTPNSATFTTLTSNINILTGSTSGVITIQGQAAAGTYNFNLPTSSGTSGQVLTSGGGGSTAMTWSNVSTGTVTSVALTVPTFLSIAGSPITSSGTLAVTLSGTALPVLNGGTGSTTATGSGSVVLQTSPTLTTPVLGIATGTSLSVTGNINSLTHTITGSSSGVITIQGQAIAGTYNFNLPITAGTSGQILTSAGGGSSPMTWTTPTSGTVTSVALTVPTFLSISGSPITSSGTLAVTLSGIALPILNGGTGTTTATGSGSVVLQSSPTLTTPVLGVATGTSLSVTGNINSLTHTITGSTSGVITIQGQAIAGTYNFNLPTSSGTSGQVLTSSGGLSSAMTWSNVSTGTVTSVALSVPSFLSVAGSPITTSGTLAVTLSGTALPILNGGTGSTTATGSGSVVLQSSPTLITPVIGVATGTSLSVTGQLTSTVSTGTAPFVVSSTSVVTNLNASLLNGSTFANPGSIGSGTSGSGSFTTLSSSGLYTANSGITIATGTLNAITASFTGAINMNSNKITNLATPTALTDAATKGYVDATAQGLSTKESVIASSTVNGTLATSFANGSIIDGVTLITGNRIIIQFQTTQTENGIYTVNATGAPTRSLDFNIGSSVGGSFVFIEKGTLFADCGFVCTNDTGNDIVGTNNITFTQFSSAGIILAGTGLTKTGNTLSVNSSQIQITTLGTLTNLTVTNAININGSTSGTITLLTQPNSGTYNFNLPTTTGTTGQVLTSTGASTAMTWSSVSTGTVTSVALTVPSFLSITGSPITTSGTLAVTLSGTALPILNGGTGSTTATGSGSVVLQSSPTLTTPVLGVATGTSLSVTGNVNSLTHTITGSTSGVITIQGQAIAGTYNFNLPTTSGTTGQVLTSTGGSTAMTWSNVSTGTVTSVALSVPTFLSVSGSPITSSGTLAVTLSGTALPILNGGTGSTTATGSGSVVLQTNPTLTSPVLGVATGTSLSVTGNVNSLTHTITGSTSGVITIQGQAVAGTYNFNLPTTSGTSGQVLTSAGGVSAPMIWTTPTTGTVTSVALSVPAFLSIAGSPITTSGTLAVTLSGTALPILNGGTGSTTATGTGSVVLQTSPTLITPVLGAATGTSLSLTSNLTVNGVTTINGPGTSGAPTGTSLYVNPIGTVLSGANSYFYSFFAIPQTTGSTTGSGSTLYIEGAPTNTSDPYSLFIASGFSYFGGRLSIATSIDTPAINPDAYNTLIIYEDQTQSSAPYSGVLTGNATYLQNNYIQLTTTAVTNYGQIYWRRHPGNAFSATFDIYNGTTGGGNGLTFYWFSTTIPGTTASYNTGITSAYSLIFEDYAVGTTPGTSLWYNGVQLGSTVANISTLTNNQFNKVTVIFIRDTIRVFMNGTLIINYQDTVNRAPTNLNAYIGFYGYNVNLGNFHRIRNIRISKTNEGLLEYTSPTSANMFINATNVGIGTQSPAYPLDVSGAIKGTNLLTNNIDLSGTTSGIISIKPQVVAGTYNFNLPTSSGTSGQVLTSGGGGASAMTWTTMTTGTVTSVALTVPTFLTVSGSPITTSGTLAVTLSGTALPIVNGGTGSTTATGTGSVVLQTSPTLTTPVLGVATGTSLSLTGNVNSQTHTITGSSSGVITIQGQAVAGTYNFNLPTSSGTSGQVLTSGGGGASAMTWTNVGVGTVTSVALTVPSFLSISGSPITSSGTLAVTLSGTALPIANGGTGTTTATGTGSVVLQTSPTLTTPVLGIATGTSLSVTGNVNSQTHTITGSTSGVITIQGQASAGTYNFNLPTSSGTSGQVLTSGGGGASAMTWTTVGGSGTVTSVALTVPSFLSISGSPITTSGTLAVTLSGTALPILNGGTGSTTATGSGSVVLQNTPTLTTPNIGEATGTSVSVTGNVNSLTKSITGSTSGVITIQGQAVAGTYNFNLPTSSGTSGQVLTSGGGISGPMTWTSINTKKVWIISDQKASGTNGGTFTNGVFQTRTLNTITSSQVNTEVTLSANIITITPGTYSIEATVPAYKVGNNVAQLFDSTNSIVIAFGTNATSATADNTTSNSIIKTTITVATTTNYTIRHRCVTSATNTGFGIATGFGLETYTLVKIENIV